MRKNHKDAFLKKHGVKLGFMSVFVKAAAFALKSESVVNAGESCSYTLCSCFHPVRGGEGLRFANC